MTTLTGVSGCIPVLAWASGIMTRRIWSCKLRAKYNTRAAAGDTMNHFPLSDFLLWCTLLNYLVLLLWFVAFSLAHDWMFKLHGRWFGLTTAQFDALHYGGMAVYKVGILLLNLVPFIALHIAIHHSG